MSSFSSSSVPDRRPFLRRVSLFLYAALLLCACASARRDAAHPRMSVADDGSALTLLSAGKAMLSYRYALTPAPPGVPQVYARSGYIHPLRTPSGFVLTRIQPVDHRHHYGLWNPWTRIEYDGRIYDLWNLGDSLGTVRAKRIDAVYQGRKMCGLDASLDHVAFTPGGETRILTEQWQIRAEESVDGYLIDFTSILRPATDKPVTIKAYRYQGFNIRATELWDRSNCAMRTSEGLERPAIDGSRARWIYVNGPTGPDSAGGFLFLSSPDNQDAPEQLRIWDEDANRGRGDVFVNFCPAKSKDWVLEPGREYVLRYRVVTYDGEMDPQKAERLWDAYVRTAPWRIPGRR